MEQIFQSVFIKYHLDFFMLASDGIWDALSNQEAINFIIQKMKKQMPLNKICKKLIQRCTLPFDPVSGMGSDNMTVIIAVLRD